MFRLAPFWLSFCFASSGFAAGNSAGTCRGADGLQEGAASPCIKVVDEMSAFRAHRGESTFGRNLPPDSAPAKLQSTYQKITNSAYSTMPKLSDGLWLGLKDAASATEEAIVSAFTHSADEHKPRRKVMHTYGTAATFQFVAEKSSPYSGLFRGGAGVMRFSYEGPPNVLGNVPGVAFKFFVDGSGSQNLLAMNSMSGQGDSTSVFLKPMSNIPEMGSVGKTLMGFYEKAFGKKGGATQSVAGLASVSLDGQTVDKPSAPYQIFLEPTHKDGIPSTTTADFREDLAKVKPGTAIYEVTASAGPGASKVRIGEIITRSPFVASDYGDRSLSFRHSSGD